MAEANSRAQAAWKSSLMRWAAIAVLGSLGFLAFLMFVADARLDAATGGLVVGAGALVFSLATLFHMVQVLARPGHTLAPKARDLAGADQRQLREEKRRLLRAINELKFDFEMGKLSEDDFAQVKQTYELRAVEVMRQLDGSKRVHPEVIALLEDHGLAELAPDAEAEAVPEPEPEPGQPTQMEPAGETEAATKPPVTAAASEPEAGPLACPSCDETNDHDAKFCKHCGKELTT